MTTQATAAVLYQVKQPLVVEDVEVLEPGAHEVLVRWVANGVCHSDLHVITGDYPHPLPVVLGHEAAGVVEQVGAAVESVKPGDHVCSSYIPSCGRCGYCIGGQPTLCALRDSPAGSCSTAPRASARTVGVCTTSCRSRGTRHAPCCSSRVSSRSARTPRWRSRAW